MFFLFLVCALSFLMIPFFFGCTCEKKGDKKYRQTEKKVKMKILNRNWISEDEVKFIDGINTKIYLFVFIL